MEILVFFCGIVVGVFAMSIAMISKRKKLAEVELLDHRFPASTFRQE
jgi:hypothetical protein